MAETTKQFWQSKTIIVGILEIAIGVLSYILGEIEVGSALSITGLLMVILRLVTDKAISFSKQP